MRVNRSGVLVVRRGWRTVVGPPLPGVGRSTVGQVMTFPDRTLTQDTRDPRVTRRDREEEGVGNSDLRRTDIPFHYDESLS